MQYDGESAIRDVHKVFDAWFIARAGMGSIRPMARSPLL